ncbi:serine O-acetyltransferase [Fretibacter rubidus]|uniref:serine O-acetyltransferase n=1 Tax=Fretibacter rubidus TaxID=570162 RepID=UPI00352B29A8
MPKLNLATDTDNGSCVWSELKREAATYATKEPALSSLLHATILEQESLGGALVNHLSEKLATTEFSTLKTRRVLAEAIESDPRIVEQAAKDLMAVFERDPACHSHLQAFMFFKGYMAIQTHRCAHALYNEGRDLLAFHFQNRASEKLGVDINPAARIGHGIMLDHATGFVMGETAVIGNDCSILQGVTLGGTGKSDEDRHPKIGDRVLIGAGASVLGNIKIGDGAKVAAGSVVLKAVEDNCTVAGVPAKPVGGPCCGNPASSMDQNF